MLSTMQAQGLVVMLDCLCAVAVLLCVGQRWLLVQPVAQCHQDVQAPWLDWVNIGFLLLSASA